MGERFEKERFHVVAVSRAQTPRRQPEQKPVEHAGPRGGHSVSP